MLSSHVRLTHKNTETALQQIQDFDSSQRENLHNIRKKLEVRGVSPLTVAQFTRVDYTG
jgi:hypothetical protein